tara:strand:+ start:176 stop:2113 length:1938 start_codon:yes stop_codon:yes gene_type:complete
VELAVRISRIWVERFRAINTLEVSLGATTALLGENNAGKSSILAAVNLFFDSAPKIQADDFHNRDTSEPIIVTIEFSDLTPDEVSEFSGNLINEKLRVARKILFGNPKESGKFFVEAEVNPDFSPCRSIDGATPKREEYKRLQSLYPDLPTVSRAEDVDDALEKWEADNPKALVRDLVAGFRGFKNVAVGKLRDKTDIVYVPAVKDTAEELGNEKSSPVKLLLNTIAKQTIENSADFRKFKEEADRQLRELTSPDKVPQLKAISSDLTGILARYYSGSELLASWEPVSELPVTYPKSNLTVKDHNFEAPLEKVGHGLQRAILFSVLEFMARDRAKPNSENSIDEGVSYSEPMSDIILIIEEPEVYQHPIKQRLFREAFKELTSGFGKTTGIRLQILYTTHSALMIDIRDFDELCVVRRVTSSTGTTLTLRQASIEVCADKTAVARDCASDVDAFRRGLHVFTSQIAEGFFATKVILVEGPGDQAVLQGYYKQKGRDNLSEGVFVVPADGKTKLERPLSIFENLGIPTFCVFDNDESKQKNDDIATNKILQRLCGHDEATEWPNGCFERFAAFGGDIENYIKSVVGEDHFDTTRARIAGLHGVAPKDALKSPVVASILFGIFLNEGHEFKLLDEILLAVDKLNISA